MKNIFTITSTLILGAALSLGACSKDKKPATSDPAMAAPMNGSGDAKDPNMASPDKAGSAAAAGDAKPAGGGW
ncbi:MAG TPA: hypothetical protein VFP84_02915 [Kofleriaceae bacterium]|nr:hypothetical protein [Kofleriaceae bacterium]